MSSALLYLAIVGVWIAVLVPMWLRREHTGHFFARRRPNAEPDDHTYDEDISDSTAHEIVRDAETETVIDDGHTTPAARPAHPHGPPRYRTLASARRRAKIIARRRRRTTLLLTLLVITTTLAATGVTPWWIVPIPAVLLLGHLSLLRVAAAADLQQSRIEARRRAAAHARREAEATKVEAESTMTHPTAEIIDFAAHAREEIYDQYADAEKRAVND